MVNEKGLSGSKIFNFGISGTGFCWILGSWDYPFQLKNFRIHDIFGLLRNYRQTGLIQNKIQKRDPLQYKKVIDCPIIIKVA